MDARPRSGGAGAGLGLIAVLLIVGFVVLRPRGPDPIPPVPSSPPSPVAIATEPARPEPTPTPTPTPEPTPTIDPIAAVSDDGVFRLEIITPTSVVAAGDPIAITTFLTYVGPLPVVQYGHGDPAVSFTIAQLDGTEQMTGLVADVCQVDRQTRGDRIPVAFVKAGEVRGIFDEAWYRDRTLRLPAGTWQIVAALEAYIPECALDADIHRNRAGVTVTVTP